MPIVGDARKVHASMLETYGSKEKADKVFYALANKQKRKPETWEKKNAAFECFRRPIRSASIGRKELGSLVSEVQSKKNQGLPQVPSNKDRLKELMNSSPSSMKLSYKIAELMPTMAEKTIKKEKDQGKLAFPIAPAMDIAGLGMLAAPSAMALAGRPLKNQVLHHGLELGGLGLVAAPAVKEIMDGKDDKPAAR